MKTSSLFVSSLGALSLVGCAADLDLGGRTADLAGQSLVTPTTHAGNFVASDDDQVCYELAALLGWDVTSEMRGFKVDPPVDVDNGAVSVAIDQPFLHWAAAGGVHVLAVIVKGGPAFNLYDYQAYAEAGNGYPDTDGFLHSPLNKNGKPAAISHYNLCYQPTDPAGDQGCTPGYWRNHTDRWVIGDAEGAAATALTFDGALGVTSGLGADYTLGQAIWAQGGGIAALARHATAALLNAHGGVPNSDGTTVAYPLSAAEVIAAVQAALADGGDVEGTKDLFAGYNELGCPLGGTPAQK
jgi:hypothetical protein